jgi:hypothetical protein
MLRDYNHHSDTFVRLEHADQWEPFKTGSGCDLPDSAAPAGFIHSLKEETHAA